MDAVLLSRYEDIMAEPEVNGRAILGLVKHVKLTGGADLLSDVVSGGGESVRHLFAARIRKGAWYPYEAYTDLLISIDQRLGSGDLAYCRQMGTGAGRLDIGTLFTVYRALASAERLIRGCSSVWKSYHRNAGRMEAVTWSPECTTVRILEFPQMHPAHCRLMEGWMIATMGSIGFIPSDDAAETRCMSSGDPFHEFVCSWRRA